MGHGVSHSAFSRKPQPFPRHPFDGKDRKEKQQDGRLIPERSLCGAHDRLVPRTEQGGELASLKIAEDSTAGGAGELIERLAGGRSHLLGGSARPLQTFSGGGGGAWYQGVGSRPSGSASLDFEPDHIGTDRERWTITSECGLTGDGLERNNRVGFACGGARPHVDSIDARGYKQAGDRAGDALTDSRLNMNIFTVADGGFEGPNRTNAFPAANRPEAAQRTTWPQNRW